MRVKISKNERVRSIFNWKSYRPIKKPDLIFKLRDKGNLIGSCYIIENFIYGLVINPVYRGNGYGKLLLNKVEKEIRKNGYKSARLIPQDNEPKLRKYYSNLGYIGYSGNEDGFEEEDKTWWIMEKILTK